jgi:hypothetical protein
MCTFYTILGKITASYFMIPVNLKFIWEVKRSSIGNTIVKNNKVGGHYVTSKLTIKLH